MIRHIAQQAAALVGGRSLPHARNRSFGPERAGIGAAGIDSPSVFPPPRRRGARGTSSAGRHPGVLVRNRIGGPAPQFGGSALAAERPGLTLLTTMATASSGRRRSPAAVARRRGARGGMLPPASELQRGQAPQVGPVALVAARQISK